MNHGGTMTRPYTEFHCVSLWPSVTACPDEGRVVLKNQLLRRTIKESFGSIRLIFHLLNSLFTFLSNTHYFGHNANLFTGIKKNNFSNGMIEAGYYGKPLIRKFRNYFIKLINRYAICNVLDPSCRIFI